MSVETPVKEENILSVVAGFQEAAAKMAELERTGTDFQEERGRVRRTVEGIHPKRLNLCVSEIITNTRSTGTLRVAAADGRALPPFQAGQYVNLFVNIEGVETARPYAISSPPRERAYYDLTIKRVENGFVSPFLLDEVEVGQSVRSTGPMGTFHHNPLFHGNDLVFFAGGSGICPAMSMLKNVLVTKPGFRFHIIYSNSYADDVIFGAELRALTAAHENFTLTEIVSRPTAEYTGRRGHVTLELVRSLLECPENKMYYICGPTPFNEACVRILRELGVKSRRYLVEGNGPPKHPERLVGWPREVAPEKEVSVTINGVSFQAAAGEPLLNSMERNGFTTENACRSGECSLCRVKLKAGKVFSPPEALIRKSDRQFGRIHACVAFPVTDVEIQI